MKLLSGEGARGETVRLIIIVLLLALIGIFLPIGKLFALFNASEKESLALIGGAVSRFIFFGIFVFVANRLGFKIAGKTGKNSLIVILLALLIAVNNFPFLTFFSGEAKFIESGFQIFAIVLFCVSVGFFEETCFRGLILPLVFIKLKGKKNAMFWSIIISSGLFGLIHLVNLLSGFSFHVFLQIGYSFLIGAMCAIVFVKTKNIAFPILIHSLYDICGKVCFGEYWNVYSIILTAAVSVFVAGAMIVALAKLKRENLEIIAGQNLASDEKI